MKTGVIFFWFSYNDASFARVSKKWDGLILVNNYLTKSPQKFAP